MGAHIEARHSDVLCVSDTDCELLVALLARFKLELVLLPQTAQIGGSYWGEPEAGIIGRRVHARPDSPVHSVLHETCHAICMTADRRAALHTDAGGDDLEESAVCYLQIVLAGFLPGVGRQRLMRDMDTWGYSFRPGSTASWFAQDAFDAREWLENNGLLKPDGKPTWILREA